MDEESFNPSCVISSGQKGSKEPLNFQSSNVSIDGDKSKCNEVSNHITVPKSSGSPKENGNMHNSTNFSPIIKTCLVNATSPMASNGKVGEAAEVDSVSQISSLSLHSEEHRYSEVRGSNGNVGHSLSISSTVDDHQTCILPHGLINFGNSCFLNATLQALLSCSPFVYLLQELRMRNIPKAGYPTLYAFVEFISDLEMSGDMIVTKKDINVVEIGKPFAPKMFEGVLNNFHPDLRNAMLATPSQQDAQEFLSFIMCQMHDELLKLQDQVSSINGANLSLVSSIEGDEWETVGRNNKSVVTRIQSLVPSELSAIFGGQLRSVVKATGSKASATIQPFLFLELDICAEAVNTIEDALHLFSVLESLKGYRVPASGKAATTSKSVKIQTLSKIMILLLKRFQYIEGCTKVHKSVRFPLELVLNRELLVSPFLVRVENMN